MDPLEFSGHQLKIVFAYPGITWTTFMALWCFVFLPTKQKHNQDIQDTKKKGRLRNISKLSTKINICWQLNEGIPEYDT